MEDRTPSSQLIGRLLPIGASGGRRRSSDSHASAPLLEGRRGSAPDAHGPMAEARNDQAAKGHAWNRRRLRKPKWDKTWTVETSRRGRVFVIDYLKNEFSSGRVRKVSSKEIWDLPKLKQLYADPAERNKAVLRVIHVQNAPWAEDFLIEKYNIEGKEDGKAFNFAACVCAKAPRQRAGKPFLEGKASDVSHDGKRNISNRSFMVDYLRAYQPADALRGQANKLTKVMDLNCYDEDGGRFVSGGCQVHIQRLAVYTQFHEDIPGLSAEGPEVRDAFTQERCEGGGRTSWHGNAGCMDWAQLDNSNTIIIFDSSKSGSVEHTAIRAHGKWESRWRQLPYQLELEGYDAISNDRTMVSQGLRAIVLDSWKAIADTWDGFLETANHHVGILEDKIFEKVDDESRAPELWQNANMWSKVERIVSIHLDVSKQFQITSAQSVGPSSKADKDWNGLAQVELERIGNRVQEDLVKPTAALADLMYKSVGIRDSRHSLQINDSLWRLSWITFIFLPLSTLSTAFSMSVDVLDPRPPVKWYFISAVPLMASVFLLWFVFRATMNRTAQIPLSRGFYEQFFSSLHGQYPALWDRTGPREDVRPASRLQWWKWWLIRNWSAPDKTINSTTGLGPDHFEGMTGWTRLKRNLIRRWTLEIDLSDLGPFGDVAVFGGGGAVLGQAVKAADTAMPELLRLNVLPPTGRLEDGRLQVSPRPLSPRQRFSLSSTGTRRSDSADRPSSEGSKRRRSAVMVEEKVEDWLENEEAIE